MKVGIIGLPNVGKSTIFNALARANAEVANYPFCTIEPNTGLISVPDENIAALSGIYSSEKRTNATIKILDVAGLVKGASKGEGLGNKFLAYIREVDVIAHVVRCFYDENVAHSTGVISAGDDIDVINTELILADIETLKRKKEKYSSIAKSGDIKAKENIEIIDFLVSKLNKGFVPGQEDIFSKNPGIFSELNLLCLKPTLYVANMDDDKRSRELYESLKEKMKRGEIVKVFGKLESELLDIPSEDRDEYRNELGITGSGLEEFIKKCYLMLNLITFYTINENESRAWPLKDGSNVLEAARKVHSDMQRGFIKAEVINCRDLIKAGSIQKARDEGKLRLEGKDYIVKDKDVIQIKFSV